jgi:hypothetical protein
MYLDKAIPPVVMLVQVFTKWFKSGGDGCHRGVMTRDWETPERRLGRRRR